MDAPDLGYVYPAIDFAANNFLITNAQVTINPGVVIASYGTNGIILTDKSVLVAEGQPFSRVVFTDYRTVQEESTNWGGAAPANVLMFNSNYRTNGAAPIARFRFTDFTTMANQGPYLVSDQATCRYDAVSLMDCAVSSALMSFGGTNNDLVGLTNNIFERTSLLVTNKILFHAFNNLFHNSVLYSTNISTNTWAIRDNAFDGATVGYSSTNTSQSNNAYVNGTGRITPTNSTEIILTNFVYTNGPLGNFYQFTTNFYDSGSRYASNAALFHHTTRADQSKESGSTVDRGFHYIALANDGTHLDSDSDGLPDWYEDKNGSGTAETGSPTLETDWNKADTDGNGIEDGVFTLYFEMKNTTTYPAAIGSYIRGPGFRVWGDGSRTIWFLFQQIHNGLPLNIWTGSDAPAGTYEYGPNYTPPNNNNLNIFLRYFVRYDLKTFQLIVSNSTSLLASNFVWRDNITERLGNDGPVSLAIADLTDTPITNVTWKPFPFSRKLRYHWEGSIGNTSQNFEGESVHSSFWPIKKMVSNGSNVFYTCGYNEGGWDVARFQTNNCQFLTTNLSWYGDSQMGGPFPNDMVLTNNIVYVRYTNSDNTVTFTTSFNPDTCAVISTNAVFPGSIQPTNGTLAIAVRPGDPNTTAVYYQATDQVVVYTNGVTNFVIGLAYGYSNGPSILIPTNTVSFRQNVKLSAYYYDGALPVTNAVVCFESNGKIWVGDVLTSRMLRFDSAGLCDTWFMYNPVSYCAFADPNNPQRVFNQYLEFRVDYSKSLQSGWVLTNYWGKESSSGRPDTIRPDTTGQGLYYVTTLTNGSESHTFALIHDPFNSGSARRFAELTTNGLRITSMDNVDNYAQLETNGSKLKIIRNANNTTATFHESYITNWSGNDPIYGVRTNGSVSFSTNSHPIDYGYKLVGNKAVPFFPGKFKLGVTNSFFTGFHLGAVTNLNPTSAGTWWWTNSPTGPLNGRGNFDTNCEYAGATMHAVADTNVFFLFTGEKWQKAEHNDHPANQFFHYSSDGTFLGQFGYPLPHANRNRPGGGNNLQNLSVVSTNGITYVYCPDEASHGVHRWRVDR